MGQRYGMRALRMGALAALVFVHGALAVGCGCDEGTGPGDGGAAPLDGSTADAASMDAAGDRGDGSTGGDGGGVDPCPGPPVECGGACVTPSVDPMNCGGCGVACAATQVCVSYACAEGCPSSLTACAGTCVDTESDSEHCGGCDMPCDPGEGCVGGSCVPAVPLGPPPARCAGGGPPIVIDDGTTRTCADGMAAVSFTFGLCACEDVGVPALSSRTLVDAYDSTMGPYEPGGGGGGVGANGAVRMASDFDVTGDLRTAAGTGLDVRGATTVGQQLHVGTTLQLRASLDVGGDAFVAGAIGGGGAARIAGALHVPACGAVPGNVDAMSCVSGPVSVAEPCACDADERVDVAGIVAHYRIPANNDDAAIGLDPAVLTTPGAPARLDLPCGYYYLDGIDSGGALTIAVHGRTALIVGDSIDVGSPITFALDPDATLDVFVGGTIRASALLTVGSPAYPRQSRIYVGGVCRAGGAPCDADGDCCSGACGGGGTCDAGGGVLPWSVSLTSNSRLAGLFYAAEGAFVSSSDLEMHGAIFAGTFHNTALTEIHYDRGAVDLGMDCPDDDPGPLPDGGLPPDAGRPDGGTGCTSCRDCGNQACIDGACGDCRTDSDCCAPLYCLDGTCRHPPF